MRVLAVVCAALLCISSALAASQPFLAWSQDETLLASTSSLADAKTSASSLITTYLRDHQSTNVAVVFFQENLSVEDITLASMSANTPSFLQRASETAASKFFFPNQGCSTSDVQSAASSCHSSVVLKAADVTEDVVRGKSAVFVRLPSQDSCDVQCADALIEKIVTVVNGASEVPVTVMLVGTASQQKPQQQQQQQKQFRQRRSSAPLKAGPMPPEPYGPPFVTARPEQRHTIANNWFSVPILSGLIVAIFLIVAVIVGTCGLMSTQTAERWPDPAHDKNLETPQ
eukprot:m.221981 g.221981  ORF g.221981 m.221981 type:complete len:286 (-) comp17015_c3_seq1:182-1039(-)